ncbi:glycosyl hydrolase family 18 protein [Francisella salina]|uniref:Chitinase n=1 Tax=Francisella salina TaxID=573569 RepID=A0ABN3ZMN8_FRAST|nr:glycosyl hydrolase family 18 protein [Francisella salina]AEI34945.1 Chitinase [Francisella salina]
MRRFFTLFLVFLFITPIYLVAQPRESINIDKTDSSLNLLPKKIIAGFLDIRTPNSTSRVDIEKARSDGYNVIIIAYGEVYNTDIGFYSSNSTSIQTTIDKIKEAKKTGMKVLLAVGGIPNTFHPDINKLGKDPIILGKQASSFDVNLLAKNIVTFLHENDIDGIVFSLRKSTYPEFLSQLLSDIKKLDTNIVISVEPQINDYKLVTTGKSNDYDKAIESGSIDYLFMQEYNNPPQYDPEFISNSYLEVMNNTDIPSQTKIIISEPTNAISGGANTIYHPKGNATISLNTKEAVKLMLPEFEKLKFKPRFAGVAGWSLNTDYAADLYGDSYSNPGAFARYLKACIYDNICAQIYNTKKSPVIAGFLPLWGSNNFNALNESMDTTPVDIKMPKNEEYCDQNPEVCKYNLIIVAAVTYTKNGDFKILFKNRNDSSIDKIYSPSELKDFISYMKSKGKHILVSFEDDNSSINWQTVNLDNLVKTINEYGFNGINFDLSDKAIPKNEKDAQIIASKINKLITVLKQNNNNLWLTFSPEWEYIVAPLAKSGVDNIYSNNAYIQMLEDIGMSNINYILLDTFSEDISLAILSFSKHKNGQFTKISPSDSYAKFIASLAWALTTQEGFKANEPKYEIDKPINIPANKLVFMIPATEGISSKRNIYTLSNTDINEAINLMKKNRASFAGFALWSMDFDATNIKVLNYKHIPWSTTNLIANIHLPPIVSTNISTSKYLKKVFGQNQSNNMNIIIYPDQIGSYDENTVVNFAGKVYRCKPTLDFKLCNDEIYIPGGLYGDLAWKELQLKKDSNIGNKRSYRLKSGEIPNYPKGIGDYKTGQIVNVANKRFECQQQLYCNDPLYNPIEKKGFLAWNDVSNTFFDINNNQDITPEGVDYIYPNNIKDYKGGTIVAVGKELYRCNLGIESNLCSLKAYKPTGKYGIDAWTKVNIYK